MKKLWLVVVLLLVALAIPAAAQDDVPVIGFMQIVSHPALNDARDGAAAALIAAGYVDGDTARFLYGNAEGDFPTLATIVQSFLDEGVDVIVATSTPALQAAYSATAPLGDEAPLVVFNSVTSPYVAGVAQASCVHPAWVTGTQALAPFADIMPLIFEIVPDADTVGYIYNPAEANSVANTEIIVPLAEELGLTLEIQTIANSSEVPAAAEALVSKDVDVFYVATDSTVVAGLEGLVAVANENEIPVIASDATSGPRGVVLARGLDYYQDGIDAGLIAAAYLRGELDVATSRINRQTGSALAVNLDAAALQGVEVPQELIDSAAIIIEGGEVKAAEREPLTPEAIEAMLPAFLENIVCTQEEIDAQLAELDS
jgi:putative ABC transport system substrate-binding protein